MLVVPHEDTCAPVLAGFFVASQNKPKTPAVKAGQTVPGACGSPVLTRFHPPAVGGVEVQGDDGVGIRTRSEARQLQGESAVCSLIDRGQPGGHSLAHGGVPLDSGGLVELGAAVDGGQHLIGLGGRISGKVSQALLAAVHSRQAVVGSLLPGTGEVAGIHK